MKKITKSALVITLLALPMVSFGAVYQYVDINGDMRLIEAATPMDALTMASLSGNMMASSGIMPATFTTTFAGDTRVTSSGFMYGDTTTNFGVGGDADNSVTNDDTNNSSIIHTSTNSNSNSNTTITTSRMDGSDSIRTSTVSGNTQTTSGFITSDGMISTNADQMIRISGNSGQDDFTMIVDASLTSGTIINENADEEMDALRNDDEPGDDPDTMIDESTM